MANSYFKTPTKAVDRKIPDGVYDGWTTGMTDADTKRSNFPAVILGVQLLIDGNWQEADKLFWLPAQGGAPSVDSELVKFLCNMNGVRVATGVDISELSDVLPVSVQIVNRETTVTSEKAGKENTFQNPDIVNMLPRKSSPDEALPDQVRREDDGTVTVA